MRALVIASILLFFSGATYAQTSQQKYFLGFDRNDYPGDDAMKLLRKDFSLPATGSEIRRKPNPIPGLANANSSAHSVTVFSRFSMDRRLTNCTSSRIRSGALLMMLTRRSPRPSVRGFRMALSSFWTLKKAADLNPYSKRI